jgi:hypothetical protein
MCGATCAAMPDRRPGVAASAANTCTSRARPTGVQQIDHSPSIIDSPGIILCKSTFHRV